MEDTTTTPDVEEQTSGGSEVQVIKGMQVDADGFAVTDDSQPEDPTEAADDQTEVTQPPVEAAVDNSIDGNQQSTELNDWASKKGIDPTDSAAALKMAREAEQKMHEATAKAAENQRIAEQYAQQYMQTPTAPVYNPSYDYSDPNVISTLAQKVNQLESQSLVANFYARNPEARQMDSEMAAIVASKPPHIAQALGQDLDTLYTLAKAKQMESQLQDAKSQGALQERARLAKTSKAGLPTSAASAPPQVSKLSDELIGNMSLEEFNTRKDEINAWAAAGGK